MAGVIPGPGELHWCTLWDDGEPVGETCRCPLGRDHDGSELPDGFEAVIRDALRLDLE